MLMQQILMHHGYENEVMCLAPGARQGILPSERDRQVVTGGGHGEGYDG
jgi:hypothetical protein